AIDEDLRLARFQLQSERSAIHWILRTVPAARSVRLIAAAAAVAVGVVAVSTVPVSTISTVPESAVEERIVVEVSETEAQARAPVVRIVRIVVVRVARGGE